MNKTKKNFNKNDEHHFILFTIMTKHKQRNGF